MDYDDDSSSSEEDPFAYLLAERPKSQNQSPIPAVQPTSPLPPNPPAAPVAPAASISSAAYPASDHAASSAASPVLWPVGTRVEAFDCRNIWVAAKVIAERGHGLDREVQVHYQGWKKRWDEWILAKSSRIRHLAPLTVGLDTLRSLALGLHPHGRHLRIGLK